MSKYAAFMEDMSINAVCMGDTPIHGQAHTKCSFWCPSSCSRVLRWSAAEWLGCDAADPSSLSSTADRCSSCRYLQEGSGMRRTMGRSGQDKKEGLSSGAAWSHIAVTGDLGQWRSQHVHDTCTPQQAIT